MSARNLKRASERGEGTWSNTIMFMVCIVAAIAAWNAGPVFWQNFNFADRLTEISRNYPPGPKGDESAMLAVKKAIQTEGLAEYIGEDACKVSSQGGIGGTRTVTCTYTREYQLIPGMKRKYTFTPTATSPTL